MMYLPFSRRLRAKIKLNSKWNEFKQQPYDYIVPGEREANRFFLQVVHLYNDLQKNH